METGPLFFAWFSIGGLILIYSRRIAGLLIIFSFRADDDLAFNLSLDRSGDFLLLWLVLLILVFLWAFFSIYLISYLEESDDEFDDEFELLEEDSFWFFLLGSKELFLAFLGGWGCRMISLLEESSIRSFEMKTTSSIYYSIFCCKEFSLWAALVWFLSIGSIFPK